MPRFALLALVSGLLHAALPTGADTAKALREAGLDPQACYKVRDLSYYKDDIKIYFNEGYLIFSRPVMGERFSAIFVGDVEGGDGELLLLAPTRAERMALVKYTHAPNLNEHFRNALLLFTDGAAGRLLDDINNGGRGRPAPEMGPVLAEGWNATVANVSEGFTLRYLQDILNPSRPGGGFFMAAMMGKQLGTFDLLYDPRAFEEIMVGQLTTSRSGKIAYEIWTRFPSRATRNGKEKRRAPDADATHFTIDAKLADDLAMTATTKVRIEVREGPLRAIGMEVSQAVEVKAVRIDGLPAELVVRESERGRAMRANEDDTFLVVSEGELAPGSTHEIEIEHSGKVIASKGKGVYYVGARSNWYPSMGQSFATYDLKFRYPKSLMLVTPGEITEDVTEGDWRTTRRTTPKIRMAGFNLGEYQKIAASAGGFNVEVYANRNLDSNLIPPPRPPVILEQPRPPGRGYAPRPIDLSSLVSSPPPPDPVGRLRVVAADISGALQYYTSILGPPPLKTLTVSPIPDTFGQGFPGLIYLSTLAFLNAEERPVAMRGTRQQTFFSDIIQAHEVAHQWWGNLVASDNYQDEWIMESLAQYSALMWIEKKKGTKALEDVLEDYRADLLKSDGDQRTLDSAGPLTWGYRIEASAGQDAWRTITYEKGAWVLHMLRQRMGDANFVKMLGEMRKRFEYRPVTTRDLQALCREFLPPKTPSSVIDAFFENWIYSTGIPTLKVKSSQKGVAPAIRVTGTVEQSGVDNDFSVEVPIEIQFAKAPPEVIWVRTSSDITSFATTVKQPPVRIVARRDLLADRK